MTVRSKYKKNTHSRLMDDLRLFIQKATTILSLRQALCSILKYFDYNLSRKQLGLLWFPLKSLTQPSLAMKPRQWKILSHTMKLSRALTLPDKWTSSPCLFFFFSLCSFFVFLFLCFWVLLYVCVHTSLIALRGWRTFLLCLSSL